ncbi:MAG TPA: UvrD-helicase domain-containing protein [Polyangiaceae bacterium]|nr:UvrD-helicase domain-containing protein [Polyangiaceae bacterium]
MNAKFSLLNGADATINVERKWALVRNDVTDDVKAFLIAHELGHLQLHPTTQGTVAVSFDTQAAGTETNGAREVEAYGARERQELQANVFAREFLLPQSVARQKFLAENSSASQLAASYGIPLELVRLQLYDAVLLPRVERSAKRFSLPDGPTAAQAPAVESDAKVSLVEAGPGTGKTTTLLLRLRRLIASGAAPEHIVVLTFSNKAARELVERARAGGIPRADRVWIGTFHAFGLEFLRKFGHLHGLDSRFPVLDKLATLAMLDDDVTSADLEAFDPLSNPWWLEGVVDAIRRAKDEVFDAARFRTSVAARSTGDPEVHAKRRDTATIFERYELLLSVRKAVDLTDLLCLPVRLMQLGDPAVERFLAGIHHLMVDEYQDVNRASALLVKELARATQSLWVVGDANQAIYAFMGASSSNLENFQIDFPGAVSIPLAMNHRSSQEIVDLFGQVASRNPAGRQTISLTADRGYTGEAPFIVTTSDPTEEVAALAWRIRQLETGGTPLAEQSVIVYKNADAAAIALGLERAGVPVLYLGNIFDRPEIKDLICLLQLAIDLYGVNLVRQWQSPLLALSRQGADELFAQVRVQEKSWRDVTGEGLSPSDYDAWENLRRLSSLASGSAAPWEALSALLLEDGAWLREMCERTGQSAANALMAIWQFVHFCRSPDGTGRWSTVKNLPQRIRDRVRLGEDRSMRMPPPEADGMDAVRILTAHGSKGLEFNAVHFLGVTKDTYEQPTAHTNKLLPDDVLDAGKTLDVLRNERHNLLYVAVSRPRFHLTVYSSADDELPSALRGLQIGTGGEWPARNQAPTPVTTTKPAQTQVSLDDYLQYLKCPQRHEMAKRAGRSQREELKLHRAVDVATRRAMAALMADHSLLADERWRDVIDSALEGLGVTEHSAAQVIRLRVEERVLRGRNLMAQGGLEPAKVAIDIGALSVEVQPDQVFLDGAQERWRVIRANKSSRDQMKQPLAALVDAHNQGNARKIDIEIATLSDGTVASVGKIQKPTRARYLGVASELCAQSFPTSPASARDCHFCPYMFPCTKRVSD